LNMAVSGAHPCLGMTEGRKIEKERKSETLLTGFCTGLAQTAK
jgi:putative Mn2+ efflux pump MntP